MCFEVVCYIKELKKELLYSLHVYDVVEIVKETKTIFDVKGSQA